MITKNEMLWCRINKKYLDFSLSDKTNHINPKSIKQNCSRKKLFFFILLLCPRHFQWGAYSITAAHMSVRPIRNTNGFHAISFEKIGILD